MKILLLDKNHPLITDQLTVKGFTFVEDFSSSYDEILNKVADYDGIIIRSRIPLDQNFLEHATNLKFIARVGAGMENMRIFGEAITCRQAQNDVTLDRGIRIVGRSQYDAEGDAPVPFSFDLIQRAVDTMFQ